MFQNPVNIHKHGMALNGELKLCFTARAVGSEWQHRSIFLPSDRWLPKAKWNSIQAPLSGADRKQTFVLSPNAFKHYTKVQSKPKLLWYMWLHITQKESCKFPYYALCRTHIFKSKDQKFILWLCTEIRDCGFSIHNNSPTLLCATKSEATSLCDRKYCCIFTSRGKFSVLFSYFIYVSFIVGVFCIGFGLTQ